VAQYEFTGVQAAGACWSIGIAARVTEEAGRDLPVQSEYLFRTQRHQSIGSIRMIDLAGNGHARLVVDSDWGGPGVAGSSFYIFDLREGNLRPVIIGQSAVSGDPGIATAEIDIARTRPQPGPFVLLPTEDIFDPGNPSPKPKISRPCLPEGSGVSDESASKSGETEGSIGRRVH